MPSCENPGEFVPGDLPAAVLEVEQVGGTDAGTGDPYELSVTLGLIDIDDLDVRWGIPYSPHLLPPLSPATLRSAAWLPAALNVPGRPLPPVGLLEAVDSAPGSQPRLPILLRAGGCFVRP